MKLRLLLIVSLLAVFSGTAVAQSAGAYEIPRTEHGQPDLQGVWNFSSSTPMQRSERYGTQEFLTAEQVQEQIERQARMSARRPNAPGIQHILDRNGE